jgi:hypothetical protein
MRTVRASFFIPPAFYTFGGVIGAGGSITGACGFSFICGAVTAVNIREPDEEVLKLGEEG